MSNVQINVTIPPMPDWFDIIFERDNPNDPPPFDEEKMKASEYTRMEEYKNSRKVQRYLQWHAYYLTKVQEEIDKCKKLKK